MSSQKAGRSGAQCRLRAAQTFRPAAGERRSARWSGSKNLRLYLHPENPEARRVKELAALLKGGALVILPTDTVYAFVTLAQNKDSVVKIQRIKDLPKNKALTLYCRDFSQMSAYVRSQGNQLFRLLKEILPGPYTLIFDAAKNLPHYAVTKQNTVGIRIIEHPLIAALLAELDLPLIGSSLDLQDFEEIADNYESRVDAVVQCGEVKGQYSTILDVRVWPPSLIREGAGAVPSGVTA